MQYDAGMSEAVSIHDLLALHAGPRSSADRERRLYDRLPPDKQILVDQRLPALDRFIRDRRKGTADPDAAAAAIGLRRRSLYHLLSRMDELGPVGAIAPTPGAGRKPRSDTGQGVSAEARALLEMLVDRHPRMRDGEMLDLAGKADPQAAKSTLRRELRRMRAERSTSKDARFGRAFALDTVALNIPVEMDHAFAWLVTDVLIDVETRFIVAAVPTNDRREDRLSALLSRAMTVVERVLATDMRLARAMEHVVWVVPDTVVEQDPALKLGRPMVVQQGDVRLETITKGKFRQGSVAAQMLGGKFGLAEVLVRATPDPRMTPRRGDRAPIAFRNGAMVLESEWIFANGEASTWARAVPEKVRPGGVADLRRLMRQLVDVFSEHLPSSQYEHLLDLISRIGA